MTWNGRGSGPHPWIETSWRRVLEALEDAGETDEQALYLDDQREQ